MDGEVKSLVFEVASTIHKRRKGFQIGRKREVARNKRSRRVEMEELEEAQCCRKSVVGRKKEQEGG